ncbi:unnamed protein product [Nesidiocoris tenuis]|uniref:non-specific serine/threonine protein kinase n=1 Tax=Nesidiocoris tenuis TaxID=355587 RepID=A0A6H5HBD2_9HEMI|nr:unnamed protein product [Nesidiocoris tenuis]
MMDEYKKMRLIGQGSFGSAYEALDKFGRKAVLKEVVIAHLDDEKAHQARKEADLLKSLCHPNIIRYFNHWEAEGLLTIAMEYGRGGNLECFISKQKTHLEEIRALKIFVQASSFFEVVTPGKVSITDDPDETLSSSLLDFSSKLRRFSDSAAAGFADKGLSRNSCSVSLILSAVSLEYQNPLYLNPFLRVMLFQEIQVMLAKLKRPTGYARDHHDRSVWKISERLPTLTLIFDLKKTFVSLTVRSPTCLTRQCSTADWPTTAVTFLGDTSSKNGCGTDPPPVVFTAVESRKALVLVTGPPAGRGGGRSPPPPCSVIAVSPGEK